MTLLALTLGCTEPDPCLVSPYEHVGTDGVAIELVADPGHIEARLLRPELALGLQPVLVQVFGAWSPEPWSESSDVIPDGAVVVRPALAGGGWGDGLDDRRGPLGRAAVAAALRYAAGVDRDAAGCSLVDRAPAADPDRVVVFGMSNGGNLAFATLADAALEVPEPAGVISWETPAGPAFVNHEFAGDDALYAPGTCALDEEGAVDCPLPSVGFGKGDGVRCFDLDGDGGCEGETPLSGTIDPASGLHALSPRLLVAAKLAGVTPEDWSTPEDADRFWSERDAARAAEAVVSRFPDLPFLLLASETDHAAPELDDHPHVIGLGEALQRAGAAWVRLNPGREASGLPEEGEANAPLQLVEPEAWLLSEEDESPLRRSVGWALTELLALP